MDIDHIKPFIPSKNYQRSIEFYQEIGFRTHFVNADLTLLENGSCTLFLQDFYKPDLAENFMLQICVKDIRKVYEVCLASKYKQKISEVSIEKWGSVFYLWGPSGELLHFTQLNSYPEQISK